MSRGMDTPLDQRITGGADLSGGQWQRVALARALSRTRTGPSCSSSMSRPPAWTRTPRCGSSPSSPAWPPPPPCFLVSHRSSTVRQADNIVVLADGMVPIMARTTACSTPTVSMRTCSGRRPGAISPNPTPLKGDGDVRDLLVGLRSLSALALDISRPKAAAVVSFETPQLRGRSAPAACLGGMTDAALGGQAVAAISRGTAAGALAIAQLTLNNFAVIPEQEMGELAEERYMTDMMAISNGASGIEHQEQPQFADMVILANADGRRFWAAFEALFSLLGLLVALALTGILLARVNPWMLLLPVAALPPVLTGKLAERLVDEARKKTAADVRLTATSSGSPPPPPQPARCGSCGWDTSFGEGTRACGS